MVSNRTHERAIEMATRYDGRAVPFDGLHTHTAEADIVITSTGAQEPIFRREHGKRFMQARRNRPMFFIDIAVPRDVDPEMSKIEGLFVYNIDDLQNVAASNMAERGREASAAETIIEREVESYGRRQRQLDAVGTVVALQQAAEQMKAVELERVQAKLAGLSEEQRAAVESMARGLMRKLLHGPLSAVKLAAEQGDTTTLKALRRGFHIGEGEE
jgi:glutamyl-tRNA reductase